jgi:hypothetical protein
MRFDANEPRIDSLYAEKREFYDNRGRGSQAALLMGNKPACSLRDVLVRYMIAQGGDNPKIRILSLFLSLPGTLPEDMIICMSMSHGRWTALNIGMMMRFAVRAIMPLWSVSFPNHD